MITLRIFDRDVLSLLGMHTLALPISILIFEIKEELDRVTSLLIFLLESFFKS